MKLCTAVQEGYGYKDTLRAHRYFAPLAKYFTVCITYQPAYVQFNLYLPDVVPLCVKFVHTKSTHVALSRHGNIST
jgi:hypothetical protein